MATGDITAVRINTSGWYAEVDISGLSTGGTYDFGFGTKNNPSTANMVFSLTSEGYNTSGTLGTMTRTVYGTNYKRKIYPNEASADESEALGTLTVLVALSDWIYNDDTSITVDIAADFYDDGIDANNSTNDLAVTNNSTEDYPRVIGNWSEPGWDLIQGESFKVRAVAFHRSGRQGTPVRCVKFTATDESTNSVTVTVTTPTIDSSYGDAMSVIEYIATISTTSLTQGDLITINFVAYPWYGDADSILNTGDAVNTQPTEFYAPIYRLCDKTSAYGQTVAVVDATDGNDGTGAVVDLASFNSSTPPNAYATISAAVTAIAAYNDTNYTRNNAGGGIIYLQEDTYNFAGGATGNGEAWCTLAKFPGTTTANVIIDTASGTKQIGEKLKIKDIKITNSTTIGFTGMDYVWVDGCIVDSTGAATFYVNNVLYFTRCVLYNCGQYQAYSTTDSQRALMRGCSSGEKIDTGIIINTVIGNSISIGAPFASKKTGTGETINAVFAFNYIEQEDDERVLLDYFENIDNTHGMAVVQNVVEKSALEGSSPLFQIAGDGSGEYTVNNIILVYNTLVGQRANLAYNDNNLNSLGPAYRKSWYFLGNVYGDYNCVTDVDPHGGDEDAARYGNHSIIHGVGSVGNAIINDVGTTEYENKFGGLFYVRGAPLTPAFTAAAYNGTGQGDYTPTASSPFLNFIPSGSAFLPYDLDGTARANNGTGAAGAYEYVAATLEISVHDCTDTFESLH